MWINSKRFHLLITVILVAGISCKSHEQELADEQYDQFRSLIETDSLNSSAATYAAFIAVNHYDVNKKKEAQNWLDSFNRKTNEYNIKRKREEEEVENRINKLGGYKLIEVDSKTKCNLFKGTYRLNKEVKDSSNLAFLAKQLAHQLLVGGKKDPDCNYPEMSQAFLYQPNAKDQEDWASMCSITPKNYSGDVFVKKNHFKN